jgi:hypothetical protein
MKLLEFFNGFGVRGVRCEAFKKKYRIPHATYR